MPPMNDSGLDMLRADEAAVYIAGQWERGKGTARQVVNPSTGQPIMAIADADADQAKRAARAARDARRRFGRLPAAERASLVSRIADVLRENVDLLAPVIAAEVGKPMREARGEVLSAAAYSDYMAAWALRIEGEIVPADHASETVLLQREALGVVLAITAWNFPLDLMMRKMAPALAAGNCVIVKPTEVTPLSAILAMKLISRALSDLDPGILGLVPGGRETGQALVSDPGIHMITMTGHRDTGKAIMSAAAPNLTRISLELGGHAPAIICADADLDLAVEALIEARFMNAGQVCTSAERILVARDVHDAFLDRFVAAAETLSVGPPEAEAYMGPLVSRRHRDKVREAVERAEHDGARRVLGGVASPLDGDGFWFAPTVLADIRPEMAVMRDETFGPVAAIMAVESFDHALEIANDTQYGLSAFVFTNDYRNAMRATRDLEFGEIYVNRTMGEALQGFHTGHKQSGIGGEDGKHGVLKYTQIKSVYHRYARSA